MKKLVTLTGIVSAMAMLALLAGCQTMATNSSEIAASKKQNLLTQAGFKFITITTPQAAASGQSARPRQGVGR